MLRNYNSDEKNGHFIEEWNKNLPAGAVEQSHMQQSSQTMFIKV